MMTSIDKQIQELLNKLQTWEDIDPLYTDEATKEIRHKILHVHARTEISLEILLANHLLSSIDNQTISTDGRLSFFRRFTHIVANIDFSKKVTAVKEANLLENSLIKKIYQLNTLRVSFSHPSAFQEEIKKYRNNPAKEFETLHLLETVYERINAVFATSMGMTERQREELEKESKKELERNSK